MEGAGVEARTMRKVMRRIIPLLFCCYVVAYLDRVNIGIASLAMSDDLHLSPRAFGWASGIFFIGYFIAEIPSNLALQRFGARRWIARILVSWGVLSAATAFSVGPLSLSVMRFLVGLAEAGFTPGVFLYFSLWFPQAFRGRAVGWFMLGIPISSIVGSPLSGALLHLDGHLGLAGWQWLLIAEGLPAVALGLLCLQMLPDHPLAVDWLTDAEGQWLTDRINGETADIEKQRRSTLASALTDWRVLTLSSINFCAIMGSIGVTLWMPQMLKAYGFGSLQIGFLAAVPSVCGGIAMVWWGTRSDHSARRHLYPVAALLLASMGLALSAFAHGIFWIDLLGFCAAVTGALCYQASFWPLPMRMLVGRAAAGGFALIISIGNLGGFAGPFLIGVVRQETGSFSSAMLFVSASALLGAMLLYAMARDGRSPATPDGQVP